MTKDRDAGEPGGDKLRAVVGVGDLTPPQAPRNFPRLTMRGEAELVAIDQGRPNPMVSIQLQDLAWCGFGFLCPLPLEVGSRWRALFLYGKQQVGEQTLVVRHCGEIEPGLYRAGAQVCVENGLVKVLGVDWTELVGAGF